MTYQYEFLEFYERLSFRDLFGLDARVESYRRIRILESGVTAVQERIWGDGDQLFGFASPLAQEVRTIRLNGQTALQSRLGQPLRAGDEVELRSIRRLHHAFKDKQEWWEFGAFVPHRQVKVAIRFPLGRNLDRVSVSKTTGTPSPTVARPGTKELVMLLKEPAIGSVYRADWTW